MLEYQQAYVFLDGRIVELVRSMLTVIRIPTIAWIVGSIKTFCRRNLHRKNIESRSKKYTNTLILLPFISRRLTFIRGSAIKSRIIEGEQTCVCVRILLNDSIRRKCSTKQRYVNGISKRTPRF